MSFYKILEEIKEITRFQLVQKSTTELELRLVAEDTKSAYKLAQKSILNFLKSKGIDNVKITLSKQEPQAHKTSGKFQHIYKDYK